MLRFLLATALLAGTTTTVAAALPETIHAASSQPETAARCAPVSVETGPLTCVLTLPGARLAARSLILHVELTPEPPTCRAAQVIRLGAPEPEIAVPVIEPAGDRATNAACHALGNAPSSRNGSP